MFVCANKVFGIRLVDTENNDGVAVTIISKRRQRTRSCLSFFRGVRSSEHISWRTRVRFCARTMTGNSLHAALRATFRRPLPSPFDRSIFLFSVPAIITCSLFPARDSPGNGLGRHFDATVFLWCPREWELRHQMGLIFIMKTFVLNLKRRNFCDLIKEKWGNIMVGFENEFEKTLEKNPKLAQFQARNWISRSDKLLEGNLMENEIFFQVETKDFWCMNLSLKLSFKYFIDTLHKSLFSIYINVYKFSIKVGFLILNIHIY